MLKLALAIQQSTEQSSHDLCLLRQEMSSLLKAPPPYTQAGGFDSLRSQSEVLLNGLSS
ncbi:hypothetical protein KSP39_PZI000332 [Platanthera zijinensis]|uniref:Uncharacterized protein n=1 Tax=Platanthera zijinensis TaxID=2320716 RepID=A0AAP0GG85_9ASPA